MTTQIGRFTYHVDPDHVVVVVEGTGHHRECVALEGLGFADGTPTTFGAGGFDLFCEHQCLDHVVPESQHRSLHERDWASVATGPAAAAERPRVPNGDGETREAFEAVLEASPAKLEVSDMTETRIDLCRAWLDDYTGDFEFLVDLKARRKRLSPGQAKGVANCWRADLQRAKRTQARRVTAERHDAAAAHELVLTVPSGLYADPEPSDSRLKVRIDAVETGKWAGWVFVKDGAEYGHERRYGKQRPGSFYQGDIVEVLERIQADPQGASAAYGRLTGTCGRCGRKLEDAESVERGIGPVCAKKAW